MAVNQTTLGFYDRALLTDLLGPGFNVPAPAATSSSMASALPDRHSKTLDQTGFCKMIDKPGTTLVMLPEAAVEAVCHDEQMVVWSSDFTGMLSLGGWLRDDLDYEDVIAINAAITRELRSIIGMAFSHPEAKTIKRGMK